jgi:very-short-patch-repair endonuclease
LDFYVPEVRLVIEVDGGVHDDRRTEDAERTDALARFGATTLRLTNEEVLRDLARVLARIDAAIASLRSLRSGP